MPKQELLGYNGLDTKVTRLVQAAPVNGTWYEVLDTAGQTDIHGIWFEVATAGETLEVRVTLNGVPHVVSRAAGIGTDYFVIYNNMLTAAEMLTSTTPYTTNYKLGISGRTATIEIRKVTAAGAGTITCKVIYSD